MLRTFSALSRNFVNVTVKRNAGHSKWANIRHIKGTKDAERSALFTKIGRQIKVAIAEGGSLDPKKNSKLENVIDQARRVNMPIATIQSVMKSCENDKSNAKPAMLEIRGPGGCIILCQVFTNNLHALKNNHISTILRKHQCKYSDGGGSHLFQMKGIVETEIDPNLSEDRTMENATEHAIEAGAEDVRLLEENAGLQFVCSSTSLKSVVAELEKFKYNITSASVEYIPIKVQQLSEDELKLAASLYQKLENLQEVTQINDNIA